MMLAKYPRSVCQASPLPWGHGCRCGGTVLRVSGLSPPDRNARCRRNRDRV